MMILPISADNVALLATSLPGCVHIELCSVGYALYEYIANRVYVLQCLHRELIIRL